MPMRMAITRAVSPTLADCELSFVARQPIDLSRAVEQHRQYEEILTACGCRVRRLPPAPELPDAVFVEDTAVVLDEIAVITRPGSASRRPEVASVSDALSAWRPTARIEAPGTLDGGDVLSVGETLYVGQSARSNEAGRRQLADIVGPHGYRVVPVPFERSLHLKSVVSVIAPDTLLVDAERVDRDRFDGMRCIAVPPEEHGAANALAIGGRLLLAAGFPRTAERLSALGFEVVPVANDELARAEGGLTCCSLIFTIPEP